MAITEGFDQEILRPEAIRGVMGLVEEARWNQLEADWRLMCDAGEAVIVRNREGAIAASALALPYPAGFGWISMVLVAGAMRRQGLATHLLADRIDWLTQRGLVPILDATEAGEPVYAKAGFKKGARLTRWQGQGDGRGNAAGITRMADETDRGWICALDAEIFGADRSTLVNDFLDRPGCRCLAIADTGFVIARKGRCATQLGPLVAASEGDAVVLMDAVLAMISGPVFFDLLDARGKAAAYISARGFEKQRGFVRMSLGDIPDFDGNGRAMVIAGPEYG